MLLDMAISLAGLIKWSLDLLVYCLQDIFDMVYDLKGKENDKEAIQNWSKSDVSICQEARLTHRRS
jgi:hypothetical protein